MPINIFDTRTMLEAVEQMPPARRFLQDSYFPRVRVFSTKAVDIDVRKGGRRVAPFVHPNLPGSVSARDGYRTDTYVPPYIQPKRPTTAGLILARAAGEQLYAAKPAQVRAAEELGKDLGEMDDEIVRAEEVMCAKALTTGQIQVVGEGVNDTINFGMSSSHKITLTTDKWDASGSDPLGNLRAWKRMIAKDSGRTANRAVLSGEAVDAFQSNEMVMKQLNTRRVDLGIIKPDELPDGVTYLGYLNDPGIDLYSYDEWFLGAGDVLQPMIPAGGLILGSTNTDNRMLYGAIQDLDAIESGLVEARRFPKTWVTPEPSVRWVKLQSAVLAGLLEPDAFAYAKVV